MEGERAFVGISGISDKRPACASVVCLRPVSGPPQRLFVALFIAPEHKKCEQKRCYTAHRGTANYPNLHLASRATPGNSHRQLRGAHGYV